MEKNNTTQLKELLTNSLKKKSLNYIHRIQKQLPHPYPSNLHTIEIQKEKVQVN